MTRLCHDRLRATAATVITVGVTVALVGIPPADASHPAGIAGPGMTTIYIQNLDSSQTAAAVADMYRQNGGPPTSITQAAIPSRGTWLFDLAAESALRIGFYAADIGSDRQIAVVARTEWSTTGGAAAYNQSLRSADVIVPWVVKGYHGQTSLFSIQNSDIASQATVTVSLTGIDDTEPLATHQYSVGPGTSTTIDMARDPAFLAVPSGFQGNLRVRSDTEVAVQSFVDIETSMKGVYAFEGVPMEEADATVYAPLIQSGWPPQPERGASGSASTFVALMNPGTAPAEVTVTYSGTAGSCVGQTIIHGNKAHVVAAGGTAVFHQGSEGAAAPYGPSGLPDGCSGAAVIEATGGRVAAVTVSEQGNGLRAAAYNALTALGTGQRVGLPIVRRRDMRLTSDIQVMNTGTVTASTTLHLYDANGQAVAGCGVDCQATIQPKGTRRWFLGDLSVIPDGTVGSGMVEGDQPLAVVVTEQSVTGEYDLAMYHGWAGRPADSMAPNSPLEALVPIASNSPDGVRRTPTPSRDTPTPTVTRTAVPPTATATRTPTSTPTPTPRPVYLPSLRKDPAPTFSGQVSLRSRSIY